MPENKDQKSPKELFESLIDFIEGPEEDVRTIPIDKVVKDLKKEGVDPSPLIKSIREKIASAKANEVISRAGAERQRILNICKVRDIAQSNAVSAKERVISILGLLAPSRPALVNSYYRKFEKATESDFESMLEDFELLDSIEGEDDSTT